MNPKEIESLIDEYLRNLLQARGVDTPDGRPLYAYRLTAEEFNRLEKLLRMVAEFIQWLNRRFPKVGGSFGTLATRIKGISALFVLYAAEWWRRRFDGSRWSWGPILESISLNGNAWNLMQRNRCVQQGLREWKLQLHDEGGLRYLGSIAVQGGLPLRMLAVAHGHIGSVLNTVLQRTSNAVLPLTVLQSWVESLQWKLPSSYRHQAVFTLLAQVARTVVSLKIEAALDSRIDPIQKLDETIPGWRERFPLPLEDAHARGLIEQLVRDVTRQRTHRHRFALVIQRKIERIDENTWELSSELDLPDSLSSHDLTTLFGIEKEELPRTAELVLAVGEDEQETTLRRLAGQDAYRVERISMGVSGEAAACEHILHLRTADGRVWSAEAHQGAPLHEELPWVFSSTDGRLLREGSGAVAEAEVWLAMPQTWVVPDELLKALGPEASLRAPFRRMGMVREAINTTLPSGHGCRIRVAQTTELEEHYEWDGRRLWLQSRPYRSVFIGKPILYRITQDDTRVPVGGFVAWKAIGAASETSDLTIGPVEAVYREGGEQRCSRRMVVLPQDAAVTLRGVDSHSGVIRLHRWGCVAGRSASPGVSVTARPEKDELYLDVCLEQGHPPVPWVEMEVFWPHTTVGVRFRFPFPAEGVSAYDPHGRALAQDSLLAVQHLFGVRLQLWPGKAFSAITLTFAIGHFKRSFRLYSSSAAGFLEVRLRDYMETIQHLLATDDWLDAFVTLSVCFDGLERFRLRIVRYAATVIREENRVCLEASGVFPLLNESAHRLPVMAMRLECPGDEGVALEPMALPDGGGIGWRFDPDSREPGAWLIYPGVEAILPFRPTLWPVTGDAPEAESPLARAVSVADPHMRASELNRMVAVLASDYLHEDWVEVERLAAQIGHLPLSAFDLWRRFARNPEGMAALAFRLSHWPSNFRERFCLELPFTWETVPYDAWCRALQGLAMQCKSSFGEEAGVVVMRSWLQQRIEEMKARCGALAWILGIAGSGYLPEFGNALSMLQRIAASARERLFSGEKSMLMQLRRLHAEDDWPTDGLEIVNTARQCPTTARYLYQERFGYADAVINLPIVLAVEAASGRTAHWFERAEDVRALMNVRAFDPEWFDGAYNETIAQCFYDGMMQVKEFAIGR